MIAFLAASRLCYFIMAPLFGFMVGLPLALVLRALRERDDARAAARAARLAEVRALRDECRAEIAMLDCRKRLAEAHTALSPHVYGKHARPLPREVN